MFLTTPNYYTIHIERMRIYARFIPSARLFCVILRGAVDRIETCAPRVKNAQLRIRAVRKERRKLRSFLRCCCGVFLLENKDSECRQ